MARIITKELAEKIAEKLDAKYEDIGAHKMAYIWHNGQLITEFGIRRGSQKDQGHDFVPKAIYLSPGQSRQFAYCNISVAKWVQILQDKGIIPRDEAAEQGGPEDPANPQV